MPPSTEPTKPTDGCFFCVCFLRIFPEVWLPSRLAYAPQEASLLASCSIRENVLCGRPWDSQRQVATAQLLPNLRDGELVYLDRYEQALITSTLSEDGNKRYFSSQRSQRGLLVTGFQRCCDGNLFLLSVKDLLQLSDGDSSLVEELSTKGLGAMQLARALFAEAGMTQMRSK